MRQARRFIYLMVSIVGLAVSGCSGSPSAGSSGAANNWGSSGHGAATVLLVCNGSTLKCPDATHFDTVQSAVDAASPGSWILIWPGVYHENDAAYHSGVWITTPDLHIRGLSRSGVVIDGSNGDASKPCPSSPALQNFAARSGIVVWEASGVTIENLTVCNYLAGPGGASGNEIWWDGGDTTGKIGMQGYQGSYLTATSMYHPANVRDQHLAQYGIYAGNTDGPAEITDSYASNMAAGAFYVGACRQVCNVVLANDRGTNSSLGYLGTNAGGSLVIKNSVFDDNRTGIAPSSLNNDDGPPPQDGLCPGSSTKSCTIIENNQVDDNNNADAPTNSPGPSVGVGIDLDGAQYDTVTGNTITGNRSWGVIANDSSANLAGYSFSRCQGGYPDVPGQGLCTIPARGNSVSGNNFSGDGTFGNPGNADLATVGMLASSATPRNCFYANRSASGPLTSVPSGIQSAGTDGQPCGKPGTGSNNTLLAALTCAAIGGSCPQHGYYPMRTRIDYAALPALPGMKDPCAGVPANTFCTAISKDGQ